VKKILFFNIIFLLFLNVKIMAAEAGMPQLDPTYWGSQAFWLALFFTVLYLLVSKIYVPKIRNSIDTRENKIRDDLDEAEKSNHEAENKISEYKKNIENAKKQVQKILKDGNEKIDKEIKEKKETIQKQIDEEIKKAEKEINDFKNESLKKIPTIASELSSKIIYEITGSELNKTSVDTLIGENLKKNKEKYL